MQEPTIKSFTVKKDIWFIPAGTTIFWENGHWKQTDKQFGKVINETPLYSTVQQLVGYADNEELEYYLSGEDEYIEVLESFVPEPPEVIEYNGEVYRRNTHNGTNGK